MRVNQNRNDWKRENGTWGKDMQINRGIQAVFLILILLSVPLPKRFADPEVIPTAVEPGRGKVAITFDDGPNGATTPVLLDGLKERGVRATFFVVGENIEKGANRDMIERMYEEGHLIGNHTYSHADLASLSPEQAKAELDRADQIIEAITGEKPWIVRAPYGRLPDGMEEDAHRLYVKWTVDPLDWKVGDAGIVADSVTRQAGEGDIILLHDCYASSVEAALRIIDGMQEQGYEFVTVDELLMN